jgi:transmembrane sensor
MDVRPDRPRANRQIQQEAAQWLVELNADEPDASARAEFDTWLRASPEHIRAYMELLPLWNDSAELGDIENMGREELIALAAGGVADVTELRQEPSQHCEQPQRLDEAQRSATNASTLQPEPLESRRAHRRFLRPLAAAAMVLIAVAAVFAWLGTAGGRTYRTGIAEIRTLTLEDGTRLSIGARSTVTVAYSQSVRALELEAGDIYVDVANDSTRPLTVEVKDKMIRALGTQFEVRSDDRSMRVSVIEGLVSVSGSGKAGAPSSSGSAANPRTVLLKAGEQITARPSGRLQSPQPIRSKEPAAWRTGRLVFDDADLGEVVREFNRYNERAFRLADPALESIPIAAAFSSADPAPLIRFLRDQPGVVVSERADEIVVDSRR